MNRGVAHVERRRRRGRNVWRARYRGPDGRERSRSFARRVDAEAFLTTIEDSKLHGEWVDPALGKTRVREYAQQWLATKADVAPRTLVNIEARLRIHVDPYFGAMALNRVQPSHVRAFVAELVRDGYAPSTVKAIYQIVAQIFAQAAVDGLVARSPCVGIETPAERQREEMHFLDAGQVAALAEAIDPRYRALIYTAAYTGLRAGELSALRVDRVDLLRSTIEVAESHSEVRGKLVTGPTKNRARRTVTMPRFLAEILAEHISTYAGDGYVFTAAGGGSVRHRNFYRRHFRPAVERAGLAETLRFHDLRHTAASLLIARGANPKQIQERLGHSTIRLTFDRYGHLFEGHDAALLDALDSVYAEARVSKLCPNPVTDIAEARKTPPKGPLICDFMERTTGFEPATLTLAR